MRATPGGPAAASARHADRVRLARRSSRVVARRGALAAASLRPELPNGRAGWVPATRAALLREPSSIVIDRSRAAADGAPRRAGRPALPRRGRRGRAPPTPTGRFAVTDRLRTGRAGSPYGCCALALTGRQTKLPPGWPGGDRLAIHAHAAAGAIGRRRHSSAACGSATRDHAGADGRIPSARARRRAELEPIAEHGCQSRRRRLEPCAPAVPGR